MLLQIIEIPRLTGALEVVRACNDNQSSVLEMPCDQRRIRWKAKAYGEIDNLFVEVDVAIADVNFEFDLRVFRPKQGQ